VPYSNLYVMPIAGGEATRVTDATSLIRGYDWLPDGRGFVVSSDLRGRQALYTIALDDRRWRPLGELDAFFPDVARGRDRVAFQRIVFESRVFEFPRDGGAGRALTGAGANDMTAQYAPDGRRLVFLSTRGGSSALWLFEPGSGDLRFIAKPAEGVPEYPRWSPDGRTIAFTARSGGEPAVFVLDVASGRVERASAAGVASRYASFTPDGRALVYSRRDGTRWHAVVQSLDDRAPPTVLEGTEGAANPVPSLDGRFVYFVKLGASALMRYERATGRVEAVTRDVHPRAPESFALTGESIHFLAADEAGRTRLMRMPMGGVEATTLRTFDEPIGEFTLAVSPDALRVAVTVADRRESDVVGADLVRRSR